ncbi:MAG: DinB family protein [Gemmatimonadaceae bacterium]
MKAPIRLTLVALVVSTAVAQAQAPQAMPSAGPLSAALLSALGRVTQNMPGAGELMPAEKFSYKPTPEQMSFGEILAHEAQSNETLCSAIAGSAQTPSESAAGATAPKEELVDRLRKSFEYCGGIVSKLTESSLGDSVPFFGGRKATRARAVVALAQDWADHYAQAAMYLRLNGILPPSARPKK